MTNIGTNIVLTSREISYSPEGGIQTIDNYEGTREGVIGYAFQFNPEVAWRVSDNDRPKCNLAAFLPYLADGNQTPETPVDNWELPTATLQKDIFEHPKFLNFGVKLQSIIRSGITDVAAAAPALVVNVYEDVLTAIDDEAEVDEFDDAIRLFKLLVRVPGVTFPISQYVIRHTRTIGTVAALTLATNNVHEIYSTAQIHAEDPIPNEYLAVINTIPTPVAVDGFLWGWLKQTPQVRKVAYGKLEITTEWWLELWTLFSYDAKS